MFKNEHKLLFLRLGERGSSGVVLDTRDYPPVRVATEDDMVTNQYTEAKLVKRDPQRVVGS